MGAVTEGNSLGHQTALKTSVWLTWVRPLDERPGWARRRPSPCEWAEWLSTIWADADGDLGLFFFFCLLAPVDLAPAKGDSQSSLILTGGS